MLCQSSSLFNLIKKSRFRFNYSKMSCIFCNIIEENDKQKIVFEDDKVVVFPDIKPAAKYHFLIVPKEHILNAKVLVAEQKSLVEHMYSVGKNVLQERSQPLTDARFGFHWPPCYSISHLHLHAIAPTQDMSFISRMIFRDNSYWFVPPEYVIESLSKL